MTDFLSTADSTVYFYLTEIVKFSFLEETIKIQNSVTNDFKEPE